MFAKFFTVALLVSATFAADCSRTYTVQTGDICDSISKSQNVSTYQLAAVNSNNINPQCTNLVPGEQLCLGYVGEDCTTTYVVQADDTCEGIESSYGINSTILTANNPQVDNACDNIYVGQVLCVASTVQAPPIPSGGLIVPVGSPASSSQPAAQPTGQPAAGYAPPPAPSTTIPTTIPPPASTPAATSGNDGGDDDNLPYCDEL